MEKKAIIRRFNLFNNQNEHYNALHVRIQQTLYYAESRFWAILNNLAKADASRNLWCQILLNRELVIYYRPIRLLISHGK